MSNQWFRFKQFTVYQERCAMKVGTDGVILGAWASIGQDQEELDGKPAPVVDPMPTADRQNSVNDIRFIGEKDHGRTGMMKRVLDVGTGTGLLALMLAQRSERLQIDAIEIDAEAANQASENVAGSAFRERIRVHHADFSEYDPGADTFYDLVICNPPYFRNAYRAPDEGRRLARHSDTLDPGQLFERSAGFLGEKGRISIIIPWDQYHMTLTLGAEHGFNLHRLLEIFPVPNAPARRCCMEFSKDPAVSVARESLVIEEHGRHGYSEAYRALTRDFYLDF